MNGSGSLNPAEYNISGKFQPTSADVERLFSKLNILLADDRNFDYKNIEKYINCYANNALSE